MKTFINKLGTGVLCALCVSHGAGQSFGSPSPFPLPPNYANVPKSPLSDFLNPKDIAACKFGARWGEYTALEVFANFKPSCDELLQPLGDEWVAPQGASDGSIRAQCFDAAYCSTVQKLVLNTANNCSSQLSEEIKMRAQEQYDLCFMQTAQIIGASVEKHSPVFAEGAGLVTNGYVLVPRQSQAWEEIIQEMAGVVKRAGEDNARKNLKQACEIGAADAKLGKPPRNIFEVKL